MLWNALDGNLPPFVGAFSLLCGSSNNERHNRDLRTQFFLLVFGLWNVSGGVPGQVGHLKQIWLVSFRFHRFLGFSISGSLQHSITYSHSYWPLGTGTIIQGEPSSVLRWNSRPICQRMALLSAVSSWNDGVCDISGAIWWHLPIAGLVSWRPLCLCALGRSSWNSTMALLAFFLLPASQCARAFSLSVSFYIRQGIYVQEWAPTSSESLQVLFASFELWLLKW